MACQPLPQVTSKKKKSTNKEKKKTYKKPYCGTLIKGKEHNNLFLELQDGIEL